MPASETQQGQQRRQLLPALFWSGVGLASFAALLVLFGGGGGLRFGAVLVIIAVVLIGLAMKLRPDAGALRTELHESMLDEIDTLRDDVRADIATAARATHRSVADKTGALQEHMDALRMQVDRTRAVIERGELGRPPAGAQPPPAPEQRGIVGRGVVQHTETVQVTTRQTIVDPHDDRGTVYGNPSGPRDVGRDPRRDERRDREDHRDLDGRRDREDRRDLDGRRDPGERHDREVRRDGRGEWSDESDRRRAERDAWSAAPREESWTDQKLRERFGDLTRAAAGLREPGRRGADEPGSDERGSNERGSNDDRGAPGRRAGTEPVGAGRRHVVDEPDELVDRRGSASWDSGDGRRGSDDPGDAEVWSGLRAGDRWASVRTDDRGQEMRMGERRASVHSDASGSEIRIEDRWAAVRREEEQRVARGGDAREETRAQRRAREERAGSDGSEHVWVESSSSGPAALPAATPEPVPAWAKDRSADSARDGVRDDRVREARVPDRAREEREPERDLPRTGGLDRDRINGRGTGRRDDRGDSDGGDRRPAGRRDDHEADDRRGSTSDSGGRGFARGDGDGRGSARGDSEGRGSGRGHSGGSARADSDGRGFARGDSEGRGFARGESDGRGFARGESDGRGSGRGHSGGFARGDSDSRGFARGDSDGRGFARGDSDGRGFARGDSDGRGFARGDSDGRGFARGDSDGRGFARGDSGGRGGRSSGGAEDARGAKRLSPARGDDSRRGEGRPRDGDRDDQWERPGRSRPNIPRQRRVEIDSADERWS